MKGLVSKYARINSQLASSNKIHTKQIAQFRIKNNYNVCVRLTNTLTVKCTILDIQEALEWGNTLNFIEINVNENLECEILPSEDYSKKYVIQTA